MEPNCGEQTYKKECGKNKRNRSRLSVKRGKGREGIIGVYV